MCADSAMVLLLGKADTDTICLSGQWCSDEMMHYLHRLDNSCRTTCIPWLTMATIHSSKSNPSSMKHCLTSPKDIWGTLFRV
eukprot:13694502-Ditylum_brightwellii.AAC.1